MTNYPKIWIDIDDVIASFSAHYLEWMKFPTHEAESWDDPRFRDHLHNVHFIDEFWLGIPPLFDSQEIDFPLTGYCTARQCHNHIVEEWLKNHKFPQASIINVGYGGCKGEALKGICDIFLDDNYGNFVATTKQGINCYLMTCSHNKMYDVGDKRVNSFKEFKEKIKNDSKRRIQKQ